MNNFNLNKKTESRQKNGNDKKILLMLLNNIIITTLLIIAIVFSIGTYFFLYPKYQEIKAMPDVNYEEQEEIILEKNNELAKINAIEKKYQDLPSEDLEKINFILPDEPDTAQIFGYLNKMTARNGFILPSIGITYNNAYVSTGIPLSASNQVNGQNKTPAENEQIMKNVGTMIINIRVSGVNYTGLKNFLGQLESDLRLFDVINIDYSMDSELSMQMQTYYFLKK